MINLTILIGDLVEQSIRHTNIKEFEANKKRDEDLAELLEQWKEQQRLNNENADSPDMVPNSPTP